VIPGRRDTLRINGRARLISDAPFFDDLVVQGHRPVLALVVEVQQIFRHCAKAFMRSELWDPQTWGDDLPSTAVLAETLTTTDETLSELERYYGADYAKGLYPSAARACRPLG
jgi:predicted pyridoxine 5'-phosphate oxidase superfamily flavin-nucleotide-binding protein